MRGRLAVRLYRQREVTGVEGRNGEKEVGAVRKQHRPRKVAWQPFAG